MGALIITTGTEADTLAIKEMAERFGGQVAYRFGSYYFNDDFSCNGKVMSATGKVEAEQRSRETETKSIAASSKQNRGLSGHFKKS
jgi:hypothetical protein